MTNPARAAVLGAQVAQLVEHVTENHGVGGSIPPLGTIRSHKIGSEVLPLGWGGADGRGGTLGAQTHRVPRFTGAGRLASPYWASQNIIWFRWKFRPVRFLPVRVEILEGPALDLPIHRGEIEGRPAASCP